MSGIFNLKADWGPSGDQPEAIEKLVESLKNGTRFQTLLGVTGVEKPYCGKMYWPSLIVRS